MLDYLVVISQNARFTTAYDDSIGSEECELTYDDFAGVALVVFHVEDLVVQCDPRFVPYQLRSHSIESQWMC